jgi:hypothetical protein
VAWFGAAEGLADSLRFPVFMSSLTADAVATLKATHRKLPKKLTSFIREHDAALPDAVRSDWRYDFRVYLLPQTGPKTEADAVMRFLREEEMTDAQRAARDTVQTIVRNKPVAVQNRGKHRAGAVAEQVQQRLGLMFTTHRHHTRAWRHYKVRPASGAARPEVTDDRYCVWDEPHGDYLYTDAWARRLVRDVADPDVFEKVTGHAPERVSGAAAA